AAVGDDALVIDAEVAQDLADAGPVGVGADDAGQGDPGAEGPQHGGHAAGAAEALLALVGAEEDDGGLLADALGVAPDVAVEHEVADDEDVRLTEALHQVDKVGGHGLASLSPGGATVVSQGRQPLGGAESLDALPQPRRGDSLPPLRGWGRWSGGSRG